MKKKQKLANYIMVAVIVLIFGAGILVTGHLQGWFDKSDNATTALLTDSRGIVTVERNGVAYQVKTDTPLRLGDKITCNTGATAVIRMNQSQLTLSDSAKLEIKDPSLESFSAAVSNGEVFADVAQPVALSFDGNDVLLENTVVSLSVRKGAQSLSVFAGTVEGAEAGQMLNWLGEEPTVTSLSITSLNDFTIQQLRQANGSKPVCFTTKELDKVVADRQAEKKAQAEAARKATAPTQAPSSTKATDPKSTEPSTEKDPTEPSAATEPTSGSSTKPTTPQATEPSASKPTEPAAPTTKPTEPSATKPAPTTKPTEPAPTEPAPTEPAPTEPAPTEPEPTETSLSCNITIRCDTILDNLGDLDPSKAPYVPSDGVILYTVDVSFTEGETVFDVLNRVCEDYGIQLEYSWTPMYNSYYIEGINNLYEFDCGQQSGWMYKVNGWFPNYGCSSYTVENGDSIVWCYTCKGLGADVGGSVG